MVFINLRGGKMKGGISWIEEPFSRVIKELKAHGFYVDTTKKINESGYIITTLSKVINGGITIINIFAFDSSNNAVLTISFDNLDGESFFDVKIIQNIDDIKDVLDEIKKIEDPIFGLEHYTVLLKKVTDSMKDTLINSDIEQKFPVIIPYYKACPEEWSATNNKDKMFIVGFSDRCYSSYEIVAIIDTIYERIVDQVVKYMNEILGKKRYG